MFYFSLPKLCVSNISFPALTTCPVVCLFLYPLTSTGQALPTLSLVLLEGSFCPHCLPFLEICLVFSRSYRGFEMLESFVCLHINRLMLFSQNRYTSTLINTDVYTALYMSKHDPRHIFTHEAYPNLFLLIASVHACCTLTAAKT